METLTLKKIFSAFAGLVWLPFGLGLAWMFLSGAPGSSLFLLVVSICFIVALLWPLVLALMSLFFKKDKLIHRCIRRGILILGVGFLLLTLIFTISGFLIPPYRTLKYFLLPPLVLNLINNIIWYLHAKKNRLPIKLKK